jgi:hypothetical protein
MNIFDRLKEAIFDLDENDLLLKLKEPSNSTAIQIPPYSAPKLDARPKEEVDNLPFTPIRKPISKPLFSKSLNLEKTVKEAPKVVAEEKVVQETTYDSFQDIKSILKQTFKDLKIYDQLPDDKEAKLLAKLYENKSSFPECVILYEKAQKKGLTLINALSLAIDKRFVSCATYSIEELEEKQQLDLLLKDKKIRLFISTQELLYHHPKLLSHYLETPGNPIKRLGTKDLFVLLNIDYYLKDPLLKRSIWNNLMAYFKK